MPISNDRPAYRVLAAHGFFGPDDHLYEEGEAIYFDDEPNEELEPLNEISRLKMSAYLEKLENLAREAAAKKGIPFTGRPRNLDGAIQVATEEARRNTAIMSSKKEVVSIERVEEEPVPEVGNTKKGRGRPLGTTKPKVASLSIAA